MGDTRWDLEGCRRGKTEGVHPDFGKKWGEWGNKNATASERGGLPWLKSKENLLFPQIIYSSIYPE